MFSFFLFTREIEHPREKPNKNPAFRSPTKCRGTALSSRGEATNGQTSPKHTEASETFLELSPHILKFIWKSSDVWRKDKFQNQLINTYEKSAGILTGI